MGTFSDAELDDLLCRLDTAGFVAGRRIVENRRIALELADLFIEQSERSCCLRLDTEVVRRFRRLTARWGFEFPGELERTYRPILSALEKIEGKIRAGKRPLCSCFIRLRLLIVALLCASDPCSYSPFNRCGGIPVKPVAGTVLA
jgi:hypothetical protein